MLLTMLKLILLFLAFAYCHGFKINLEEGYEIFKESYNNWARVFPGTLWCGETDIAISENDLGLAASTDRCCRAHHNCRDTIIPGETKYNITNMSSYTKYNCDCECEFYDCLKGSNTLTSKAVGYLYFNVLGQQCYYLTYNNYTDNVIKCKKEYEENMNATKVLQWVDVPRF